MKYQQSAQYLAFTHQINCNATLQKTKLDIFNTVIKGCFVQPVLTFEPQNTVYEIYCPNFDKDAAKTNIHPDEEVLQSVQKNIVITNRSNLPITLHTDVLPNFDISEMNFTIEPSVSKQLIITFHSRFKREFVSEEISKKLNFEMMVIQQKQA